MPVPPTVLSNMDHTFHTFEEVEQMDDGALARIGLKWEEYGQGEGIAIKCTLCDAWVPNSGHLTSVKHGRKLKDYLWQADVRARRAMATASNDSKVDIAIRTPRLPPEVHVTTAATTATPNNTPGQKTTTTTPNRPAQSTSLTRPGQKSTTTTPNKRPITTRPAQSTTPSLQARKSTTPSLQAQKSTTPSLQAQPLGQCPSQPNCNHV